MKVVILCGGLGTRLGEETNIKPKPMVTIGSKPILWHIMNIFAQQGFYEFVLALGYRADVIKEYFLNYYTHNSDLSIDLESGKISYLKSPNNNWKIDLIDTGSECMTGGRLHRLESHLKKSEPFIMTYGDGLANVNLKNLLNFHRQNGKIATVTSVRPPARFGNIAFEGSLISSFKEKPQTEAGWINGGFFVLEPDIFNYLDGDATVFEGSPLERLALEGQLSGYKHDGFWQCMDTVRDKNYLEELIASNNLAWTKIGQ